VGIADNVQGLGFRVKGLDRTDDTEDIADNINT